MNLFMSFILSFIFTFLILGIVMFFSYYKKYKQFKNVMSFIWGDKNE